MHWFKTISYLVTQYSFKRTSCHIYYSNILWLKFLSNTRCSFHSYKTSSNNNHFRITIYTFLYPLQIINIPPTKYIVTFNTIDWRSNWTATSCYQYFVIIQHRTIISEYFISIIIDETHSLVFHQLDIEVF